MYLKKVRWVALLHNTHADCVKYIYKILDFFKSSMKSLTWQGILN